MSELGALDVLAPHSANRRGREKKLADLRFVPDIEDSHTVTYALKKLAKLGLVRGTRRGKETFHAATEKGAEACAAYRAVRESCLIATLSALSLDTPEIGLSADLLRALSGLYDQAARAAASL